MILNTIEFEDSVCLDDESCVDEFSFYSIYRQYNMPWIDGVIGIAPIPNNPNQFQGPSFVNQLKKQNVIDKAIVAMKINEDEDTSLLQFGAYNETLVDGEIKWFSLTNDTEWQTYITDAKIGDLILFTESSKQVVFSVGHDYIGLSHDSFDQVSAYLMEKDPSIYCDHEHCFGQQECAAYENLDLSLSFALSKKADYTVSS